MDRDWTQFTRKIRIRASRERVYKAWASRYQLATWFLASCEPFNNAKMGEMVNAGDKVLWTWHNYPNESEIEILEANAKDKFAFTFGAGMEVKVTIKVVNDWTEIELRQYNIPTDEASRHNFYVGCSQAWSTWLVNLKSWLEKDILLHDKELGNREDLFQFVNT